MRGLIISVLLGVGSAAQGSSYEQPDYTVVAEFPLFEVRAYPQRWVAETTADGGFESARNAAFRRLFDYISGANSGANKIAMTVPVVTSTMQAGREIAMTAPVVSQSDGSAQRMQFFLPADVVAAGVPQPRDPRVVVRQLPAETLAVRRYSGRSNEANHRREEQALLEAVAAAGMEPLGAPRMAVYNGPFTPRFWRHNEVLVPVATQSE